VYGGRDGRENAKLCRRHTFGLESRLIDVFQRRFSAHVGVPGSAGLHVVHERKNIASYMLADLRLC